MVGVALASILGVVALAGPPDAEERGPKFGRKGTGFGLGLSLGDPLGLSAKYFLRAHHALSAHLAWGVLHHGDGLLEVDYHWHSRPIGNNPIVDAFVYVGGGLGVAFWARTGPDRLQGHNRSGGGGAALLIRAPALGLAYHWANAPLDTAIELAWSPYLILPDLAHIDASIKVRYFF